MDYTFWIPRLAWSAPCESYWNKQISCFESGKTLHNFYYAVFPFIECSNDALRVFSVQQSSIYQKKYHVWIFQGIFTHSTFKAELKVCMSVGWVVLKSLLVGRWKFASTKLLHSRAFYKIMLQWFLSIGSKNNQW